MENILSWLTQVLHLHLRKQTKVGLDHGYANSTDTGWYKFSFLEVYARHVFLNEFEYQRVFPPIVYLTVQFFDQNDLYDKLVLGI